MVEAFRRALYDLEINEGNIAEIRELASELEEMMDQMVDDLEEEKTEGARIGSKIAVEIIWEYRRDTGNDMNGNFRCVEYDNGIADNRLCYTNAEFSYVGSGPDPRSVTIRYHREYDTILDDGEIVEEGPKFYPTKEEARELYDDFLVWLTKQEFCGFIDV